MLEHSKQPIRGKGKEKSHCVRTQYEPSHTDNVDSMDQERTFIHHKTGQPTTMKTVETCFQKTGENGQKVETLFHLDREYQVQQVLQIMGKKG
mgnify:CR=1 FL=1